jgi:hypothetical protein
MTEEPPYAPAHPTPSAVWLSSEEVKAAIVRVGLSRNTNAWRACCWDIGNEINNLIIAGRHKERSHD